MSDADQPVRVCGVSQALIEDARRRQYQWVNKRALKYFIGDRIPGIPLAVQKTVFAAIWGAWQRVCGLTFAETLAVGEADIVMLTRPIDGQNGTLAEAQLPPGNDMQLRMWFDVGERWHAAADLAPPTLQNLIDLLAVGTHEAGHSIGLSHDESPQVVALMDAFYSPRVRTPQPADIQEAVKRYGPAVEEPKPLPDPGTAPAEWRGLLEAFGAVYQIEGKRITPP